MQEIILRFVNPFWKFDEYELFKELIFYLRSDCVNYFNNFYGELSDLQKGHLKDLCNTVRINAVDDNQKEINIPRRIVKIRKNNLDNMDM